MTSLLRTLSGEVRRQRRDWARSNPSRLKYEPGPFRGTFDKASAAPMYFVGWMFVLYLLGTWASGFKFVAPYPGPINFMPLDEKYSPSSSFMGLWAVQAAMVAVVYPIVVAFVTVLIQRQSASKASLQAYFVASSAKLTGLSSLMLVLVMSIQFVLLDSVPPLTGFVWLVADGAWFALNSGLSLYFLAATFQFASPDGRIQARNRYVLTRAWPEEWAYHLTRLLALDPIKHGLLNATQAADDLESNEPAFSAIPHQFGSQDALLLNFRGAARVVDVRYLLLQWAFNSWARRAERANGDSPETSNRVNFTRKGPVLEMGVLIYQDFSHLEPVYRFSSSTRPNLIERTLLRSSVSLSSRPKPRVTVLDALDEARLDATAAIQQDAVSDFEKRLVEFLDFFDQVIESSHHVRDGTADNWSLLASSENFWSEVPIGQQWEKAFMDLNSAALAAVERRSDFAKKTVRIPSRFFLRQSDFLCPALKKRYLSLQFWHLRQLLDWGAEKLSILGDVEDGGRLLAEPLRRRYEEVLKDGVSAWESLKNARLGVRASRSTQWDELQEVAPLFELHVRRSALLVSCCLRADDRAGVYWLGDSFLKWRSQLERHRRGEGVPYVDRFKVVYDDLLLTLDEFRQKFPLGEYETENDDTVRAAWHLGISNLWTDVGLQLLATTVLQPGSTKSRRALAAAFVRDSLTGTNGDSASAGSERVVDGPDRIVASLIRQHAIGREGTAGYDGRMEELAESFVPSAVSEGISGRIYSSVGTAQDAIGDGYLILLAILARENWRVSSRFDDAIRNWKSHDALRQRLVYFFKELRERALSDSVREELVPFWSEVQSDAQFVLAGQLDLIVAALDDFIRRVEDARTNDIQNLQPHADELTRLEHYAGQAFEQPLVDAPLCFFASVQRMEDDSSKASPLVVCFTGWDKGSLTRPRMAEPVSNEDEYIRDSVRQTAASGVVRDLLQAADSRIQGVANRGEFRAQVEKFGRDAVSAGRRPLLLVSSSADPAWLIELARRGQVDGGVPPFRKLAGVEQTASYCGHIGDTEVHTAPVPRGESVLCVQSLFERLEIPTTVLASTLPEAEPHRCTLKLQWNQRASFDGSDVLRLQHAASRRKAVS